MPIASFSRMLVRRVFALYASIAATVVPLIALTPSALDGFDPNVDGNVYALATQPDGRIIAGGQFSAFHARDGSLVERSNIARLNPDGSVDPTFNPTVDGPVRAIVIQPDGRIVIGGDFTTLQPGGSGATISRSRLARLNPDGTVDATFDINIRGEPLPGGGELRPQVFALALQPNGSILVGGSFASVQPGILTVLVPRKNLLRLTSAGVLDANFDPHPNGMVLAVAPHLDGRILVGGGFTSLWPAGAAEPTTRNRIARLNANGTVDPNFDPNANNGVTSLAVQRDGKVVLGGYFTTLQPPDHENALTRNHLARLEADGSIDYDFDPSTNGHVMEVAVAPEGGILVGGTFTVAWGRGSESVGRSFVARFSPDGSLDPVFDAGVNAQVDAFAFQSDGKIILGGYFTRAVPRGASTARVRNRLARLNPDGSLDANFEPDAGGRVLTAVTQPDGRIVIGGSFTNVAGSTRNYVARLDAGGSLDPAYNPNFSGPVYTMALQPNGQVIVGGAFTTVGGETRNNIARLNANGTVDAEFNPNLDGHVGVVVLQPDGRILVGGAFSMVQPPGAAEPVRRSNLLRLNANGTLDTAFDPAPNSSVSALALQSDGKILVGGQFSAFTPGLGTNVAATTTGRGFIARLNADGTLDTAYSPAVNNRISAIVIQADGKAVIAGAFTSVFATGATEAVPRNHILRLNADGTLDAAFDPNASGNVLALALQADGRLVIGGTFITLTPNEAADWTLIKYAARLNPDGTVDPTFNLDIDEQPGNRVDLVRLQPDGRLLIGGNFTSLQPVGTSTLFTRKNLVRVNANGTVDATFDPGAAGAAGGQIHGFAIQADSKVIAVGAFTDLGGARTTNIARFNPEGTPDATFNPALAADGAIRAVAIRTNAAPVSSTTAGFAWLEPDGSLRTTFDAAHARLSGRISTVAVQDDGGVLLGGAFANLTNTTGGNLVRFNQDGTLDDNFNPAPNGPVSAIVTQADGRIVIAGAFSTVHGAVRNRIARLNADGSLDAGFDPNVNAPIHAMVLDAEGRIIIGGSFTTLTPNEATTATTRNFIARINADGTLDATYNPSPDSSVFTLAIDTEGRLLAGGAFTAVQPNNVGDFLTRTGIARFMPDGSADNNFDPNPNGTVNAIVAQPDGAIVFGGAFTTLKPRILGTETDAITRNNIARVDFIGVVDPGFDPNANGPVMTLARQADGGILLGGRFTTLQPPGAATPVTRDRVARVNRDGTLDLDFNPDVNGEVNFIAAGPSGTVLVAGDFTALQPHGAIVLGGNFAAIGGMPVRNLAAVTVRGSVSTAFQPQPNGAVNALLVQPDGKVVVGGDFTSVAGAARSRLARFNADATLDPGFDPAADVVVSALALQSGGRIVAAGRFSGVTVGGNPAGAIVRLNPDGSVDSTFANRNNVERGIRAIAVQADDRIVAIVEAGAGGTTLVRFNADGSPDGTFTPVANPSGSFHAIALQADGRILVGGEFTLGAISRLARFHPDGSVDESFNPAPNGPVTALALQSDGRLMIGGNFTNVGGVSRAALARLAPTTPAMHTLGVAPDRRSIVWQRGGGAGEVSAVSFEQSPDRVTWTQLGSGSRVSNGWAVTVPPLPDSGVFYIRARGIAPSSGSSSSIYEMVREFNFASAAFAPSFAGNEPSADSNAVAIDPFTGILAGPVPTLVTPPGSAASTTIVDNETVEILVASRHPLEPAGTAQLTNLSTRGRVAFDSPLILGFAIAGSEPRELLLRAVGPALGAFGVGDALSATRLEVYDASGALLALNEGWANEADITHASARTGAFPLAGGSGDSAALLTLEPGVYTMQVVDTRGAGGVALAEIYDADNGTGSRLVNVSSRGGAGLGGDALISGFVVTGDASQQVLLRGIGPGLAQFGAAGVASDPSIALYDSAGNELGSNDNWVSSSTQLATATSRAGAFPLVAGSKDASVVATLPPGAYTIQVRPGSGGTGAVLLEVYVVE